MICSNYIGKRLADFNHAGYGSFQPNGIKGQCVWYVRGRAYEKIGANTGITGNANTWFSQAIAKGLRTSKTLETNSIICLNRGAYGHVIFIECVDGNTVYYTEANSNGDNKISADDGILKKCTVNEMTSRAGYAGCICLTKNKTNTEDFEMAKTWKNGKSSENVYADTALKTKIGTLDPYEKCECLLVVNGRYIVKYKVGKTNDYKVGFVKYSGGIK